MVLLPKAVSAEVAKAAGPEILRRASQNERKTAVAGLACRRHLQCSNYGESGGPGPLKEMVAPLIARLWRVQGTRDSYRV